MNNEIFIKGMKNEEYLEIVHSKRRSYLTLLYYLGLIILNKKKECEDSIVFFDYDNASKYLDCNDEKKMIYHGRAINSFNRLRNAQTCVSNFNFLERIKIVILAIGTPKSERGNYPIGYYMDFLFLQQFITEKAIKSIVTCETIDRYALWLCELENLNHGISKIVPHGTLIREEVLDLPYKFHVDCIEVWNETEKNIFEKGVLRNKNCNFIFKQYIPSVKFEKFQPKKEACIIGIFSQCDSWRYKKLVERILKEVPKVTVIMMLHPLERLEEDYSFLLEQGVIIEKNKKYLDLDIVITGNSTIIYDLIYSGYKGEIICNSGKNDYEKVSKQICFAKDFESILQKIKQYNYARRWGENYD